MLILVAVFALAIQETGPLQEVEEVRREIELLRQINTMNLSRDQVEKIVKLTEGARKEMDKVAAENKDALAELATALKEVRDSLLKGEKLDPEKERTVGELQRAAGEVMRAVGEIHEKFAADLKAVFDEKQWKAVSSLWRPDPTRGFRENLTRLVERMRQDPDADPTEMIREQLKRMARPLGLAEGDLEAETERIVKLLNEAANAEDPEPKLKLIFEEGKLAEGLKKMAPPQGREEDGGRRVAQFFLEPRTAKTLRKKLEAMK